MNLVKRHFDLLFAVFLAIVFASVVRATSMPLGESLMLALSVGAFWLLVFSVREALEIERQQAVDPAPAGSRRVSDG